MKNEPTLQTRREFLRTGVLGGALTWTLPSFVHVTMQALCQNAEGAQIQSATGKDSPILVVLQMAGGNDGLNTVVPIENDLYYKARPSLALPKKDCLKLDGGVGLHPAMTGLKALYDDGELGIIQGVGYPNPNRSHFRSMEIWHTASDADKVESLGWIGRYFDCCCEGTDATVGISLSQETPQAFAARMPKGLTFQNPNQYRYNGDEDFLRTVSGGDVLLDSDLSTGSSIADLSGRARKRSPSPLDFLERTSLDAQVSSEKVQRIIRSTRNSVSYPQSKLANDLATVAKFIASGMPTRVYYVSQGGYDTHVNQKGTHERLLGQLSNAIKAFRDDLAAQGNLDRVVMMTFSEFGRRVSQNASGGTDHGTASPMFIFGGRVKPGLHGAQPALDTKQLDQGDLRYKVDFRSVYASILEKQLGAASRTILNRSFPAVNIFTA